MLAQAMDKSRPATFRGQSGQRERQRINQEPGRPTFGGRARGANSDRQSITGRDWAWESEGLVVAEKRVMIVEPRSPNAERAESEEGRAD